MPKKYCVSRVSCGKKSNTHSSAQYHVACVRAEHTLGVAFAERVAVVNVESAFCSDRDAASSVRSRVDVGVSVRMRENRRGE